MRRARRSGRYSFNDKVFGRFDKFDGRVAFWRLERTDSQPHQVIFDEVELDEELGDMDVHRWATEVCDSLSLILQGDVFAIARGAPDMSGVESWRRGYHRCNPSVPAPAMNALMRVMALGRVKHHEDLLQKTSINGMFVWGAPQIFWRGIAGEDEDRGAAPDVAA